MEEIFVRKYWPEEDILYYLQFQDGEAVKQIEVTPAGRTFLSLDNPVDKGLICDQPLHILDIQQNDFISRDEFFEVWNDR